MSGTQPEAGAEHGAGAQGARPGRLPAAARLKERTVLAASIDVPDELVEQIAQRTAELLRERPPALSPFLDVAEAADYLRTSKQRVYDLSSSGRLRAHRDGRRLLFRTEDLDAVLDVPEGGGGA